MRQVIETIDGLKLKGSIPDAFEQDVLRYKGSRRYVATWWSEDEQSLVYADGEVWRVGDMDEDGWVWWAFTLTIDNDFDINSLGFDIEFPADALLLDLEQREVWVMPLGLAFDLLITQMSPQENR